MLVRMTFVKRYTAQGFLYRRERAYRVDEDHGTRLLNVMVNDMPVFKMVTEDMIPDDVAIIDLVEEEEAELPPPEPKPKKTVVTEKKEAPAAKKPVAKKKAAAKLKKPAAKTEPDSDDVEMI